MLGALHRGLWLVALAGCSERVVLTIPYPDVTGAQSEVLVVGAEGWALRYGEPLRLADPLPDQAVVRVAAAVYQEPLEQLGLQPGPITPGRPGRAWRREAFTLDVVDGKAQRWQSEEDPAVEPFLARYAFRLGRGSSEVHTCFISATRELYCMGQAPGPLERASWALRRVPGLDELDEVAGGIAHTCVLRRGRVLCLGKNNFGQLGQTSTSAVGSDTPLEVLEVRDAIELDAHGHRTCALERSGKVICWGTFFDEALGPIRPTAVAFDRPIEHIAVGTKEVCGIAAGDAYCQSTHGALSYPGARCNVAGVVFDEVPVPLTLPPGLERLRGQVREVTLGDAGGCLRSDQGEVYCWGCNVDGEVGTGAADEPNLPLTRLAIPKAISVQRGAHAGCAITEDHRAYCWGKNDQGQVGRVAPGPAAPELLRDDSGDAITDVVEIALYWDHGCIRLASEEIRCFGRSDCGQLGDGDAERMGCIAHDPNRAQRSPLPLPL